MNIFYILKTKRKPKLIILVFLIIIICYSLHSMLFANKIIIYNDALYAFNVNDYREVAAFYKYIFVGRIEAKSGVSYDKYNMPTTEYQITPLVNIKGDLMLDKQLPYRKTGGLSISKTHTILISGDVLPEVGRLYIFCTRAIDEGKILFSSGVNTTIPLEENITEKNIFDSIVVSKMLEASENPKYHNSLEIKESTTRSVYDKMSNQIISVEELTRELNISKRLNDSLINEIFDYPDDKKLAQLAGNYNYFFVGKVTTEGKLIINKGNTPYIEYMVTPVFSILDGTVKNYSGQQFVENIEIPFIKYGGLSLYDDGVEISRPDFYPEPGRLYMFTCTSTTDGTILYSYSPYAIIPIEDNINEAKLTESELVMKFIYARKNPAQIDSPVQWESGNHAETRYTLQNYYQYQYNQEMRRAEKENREPNFDILKSYEYHIPDWLVKTEN